MYFYDSDTEPVYSLAHVDDIIVVGATSGYEKLRAMLGDNFLVTDIGNVHQERSKLAFLGRASTRVGDEVHVHSSRGYNDGLLEILRLSRANGSETTGASTTPVTFYLDSARTPEEHSLCRTCVGNLQM